MPSATNDRVADTFAGFGCVSFSAMAAHGSEPRLLPAPPPAPPALVATAWQEGEQDGTRALAADVAARAIRANF
eukprot:734507-Prymnesium_polylepis.1